MASSVEWVMAAVQVKHMFGMFAFSTPTRGSDYPVRSFMKSFYCNQRALTALLQARSLVMTLMHVAKFMMIV